MIVYLQVRSLFRDSRSGLSHRAASWLECQLTETTG